MALVTRPVVTPVAAIHLVVIIQVVVDHQAATPTTLAVAVAHLGIVTVVVGEFQNSLRSSLQKNSVRVLLTIYSDVLWQRAL